MASLAIVSVASMPNAGVTDARCLDGIDLVALAQRVFTPCNDDSVSIPPAKPGFYWVSNFGAAHKVRSSKLAAAFKGSSTASDPRLQVAVRNAHNLLTPHASFATGATRSLGSDLQRS